MALNGAGVLVAVVTLAPIVWMISTAFKPQREIFSLTPHPLPAHPTLANFHNVFSGSTVGISFWTFFANSLLVTLTAVVASSLASLLAAVAVARFRFRFRTSFLIMLLVVQMLPQQALVIALFIDFRALNLLDSLPGLILLYTAFALPISIWMLRNFVAAVPREMEEAAAIDGAGPGPDLLADPSPAGGARPGGDQRVLVHLRLERVHLRAHVPEPQHPGEVHPAHLRDVLHGPAKLGLGGDHGRRHPLHHPAHPVLPAGAAPDGARPGRRGGERVSGTAYGAGSLTRLADAVLVPPFPGRSAPRWLLLALENGLAGVTLYGPNVAGPEQLSALTAALRAAAPEPVIAIDEEGGDVTRLAHLTGSPYPGNAALGAVDDASLTRAVYRALGADLAAVGINVDLAPSVDVNTAAGNPVIGTRAFGDRTGLVSRHAAAAVHGLQAAGVAACAKHFPGHGSTRTTPTTCSPPWRAASPGCASATCPRSRRRSPPGWPR